MVVDFGEPIQAAIHMVNIASPVMQQVDTLATESHLTKKFNYKISFIYEQKDASSTLIQNIDKAVKEYSPSLLVMFTNQGRSLLELLFTPSQTEKYSFRTIVPLLAYAR